jgi:hypothetical protein
MFEKMFEDYFKEKVMKNLFETMMGGGMGMAGGMGMGMAGGMGMVMGGMSQGENGGQNAM